MSKLSLRFAAWASVALLALALAGCGGGGGGSGGAQPPPQGTPLLWHAITAPQFGGIPLRFGTCGPSLVVQASRPMGPAEAATSTDHGLTWQNSPLAAASLELDASGYYWHAPGAYSTVVKLEETRDCGATWTSLGQGLMACLGNVPNAVWRAGVSNQLLYAQVYQSATGQFALCTSADEGQTWSPGPALPANTRFGVEAVRGVHWFAVTNMLGGIVGLLMRSDDQGQTWRSTGLYSSGGGLRLIEDTAHGPKMCVVATNQVPGAGGQSPEVLWLWDDTNATWTAAPPFPPAIDPSAVISLDVNPAALHEIFLSRSNNAVFLSPDSGVTWVDVTAGLPGPSNALWWLVFDPSLPNHLYAWMPTTEFWATDLSP